jgi:hypothetical protein
MTCGFVRACAALFTLPRKRLRKTFTARPLRAHVLWLACAMTLGAMAGCSGHDDERATLTQSAARELAGTPAPQAANAITPYPPAQSVDSATDVALPPLAVRTPARPPAEGGPAIDPLVTPVIHTAD